MSALRPAAMTPPRPPNPAVALHPAAASTGEERARRVRVMFSGIAPTYERVNALASLGRDRAWRRATIAALRLQPGDWCLDACAGTGDLSREIARLGARPVSLDFCREMLASGLASDARLGVAGTIERAEADALRLPLRDDSMNAACIGFGLRNLADPPRGLAEMTRVVRAGGRLAVLEFGTPGGPGLRFLHGVWVGRVVPWLGDLVSGSRGTYRYLPQTIASWPSPDVLADMMREAGLRDVSFRSLFFGAAWLHVGTVPARMS